MAKVPKRFAQFMKDYPEVGAAYTALGEATGAAGPLDAKTRALVKIGISVGARMEGAAKSHIRKAVEVGCTAEEIRHAILQSATTIGFPNMMAGLSWVDNALSDSE